MQTPKVSKAEAQVSALAIGRDSDDRLLTQDEVVQKFGLGARFLEMARTKGDGPVYVKVGRAVRYRAADVRAWLAANTIENTSRGGK